MRSDAFIDTIQQILNNSNEIADTIENNGSMDIRIEQTQPTPAQSTPAQSTPTQSTPPQSTPTQPTPTHSTPTQSTPNIAPVGKTCKHGEMTKRTGTGAKGQWKAFMCPAPKGAFDKCKNAYVRAGSPEWNTFVAEQVK